MPFCVSYVPCDFGFPLKTVFCTILRSFVPVLLVRIVTMRLLPLFGWVSFLRVINSRVVIAKWSLLNQWSFHSSCIGKKFNSSKLFKGAFTPASLIRLNRTRVCFPSWRGSFGQVRMQQSHSGAHQKWTKQVNEPFLKRWSWYAFKRTLERFVCGKNAIRPQTDSTAKRTNRAWLQIYWASGAPLKSGN